MNHAIRKWSIALAGSLLTITVLVGEPAQAEQQTRPMSFRHLTVADGLSQNTVMDVLQDDYGYMWLATENGLDRYDGYDIHSYQRGVASEGDLANDYIWKISQDDNRNLWLATEGGGVAFWNRRTDRFEHVRHKPEDPRSLSSDRTRTLLHTNRGVWVGTHDAGLNLLDVDSRQVTRFRHDPDNPSSLPSDSVYSLVEDSHGGLWIGTDGGLAWLQSGSQSFVRFQHDPDNPSSLSNNQVRAVHLDGHGAVWVGTFGGGLNMFDRRSGRFTRFTNDASNPNSLSHDHVRAILEDDAGRLWIATENGLNVLPPYAREFNRYYADDRSGGLSGSYLMSLHQDRSGVLWVGTRTGGVNSWNSRSWRFGHTQPDWLTTLSVTAMATDAEHLWLGTLGGGLKKVHRQTQEVTHIDSSDPAYNLKDDRVMSLLVDHDGGLWVGTMHHGVAWMPRGGDKFKYLRSNPDTANSLVHDSAMSIFEDAQGRIWIGSYGAGITRYDPETREYSQFPFEPSTAGSFCGNQGRDFALDQSGQLWVATEHGVCRFDRTSETFTGFQHDENNANSIAANSVFSLHRDGEGRLWAGTGGGGLNQIIQAADGKVRFETLTRRHGLASNVIYGVRSDTNHRLWISSNVGLTRYDPQTDEVTNFRRAHGLQGEEYHYGATHQSANGRLYFGGANGFNSFDPLEVSSIHQPPPVVLTQILKMNTPVQLQQPLIETREIELGYLDSSVTFEFAALDFTEPANNRYRYQLQGFDGGWIDAGTRSSVTYTNLDGGRYLFRVIAASSEGVWNEEGVAIGLTVAPAPWLSAWAYSLYVLAFASALVGYLHMQRRKLARHEEYLKRLELEVQNRTDQLAQTNADLQRASDAKSEFLARMSHEIRSPIHGVLGMTELLDRTPLNEKQRNFATTIRTSAESLLAIINDVLDFSKLDSEKMQLDPIDTDVESLLDDVVSMFALQAQQKNLELICRVPAAGIQRGLLDPLRLRQVLVNLINNAIKFTVKGRIELIAEVIDETAADFTLGFRVRDTGIGIAPENQTHIFDSFSQESSSTAREFGGTGLGLSISKELVELMGGVLNLASLPGEGSTFSFILQLPKTQPQQSATTHRLEASALVVIHQPALARQIHQYLSAWGVHCQKAHTVDEAIQALSTAHDTASGPNLLIMEDNLESMTGTQCAQVVDVCTKVEVPLLMLQPLNTSDIAQLHPMQTNLTLPLKRSELWQCLDATICPESSRHQQPPDEVKSTLPVLGFGTGMILVVEDSIVNQEVLGGMLTELGCSYTLASDGRGAVNAAEYENFAAILMDYQLPDISGIEASRRIRASNEHNAQVPIIALTANASVEDRERFLAAGLNDFLAKPCTIGQLGEKLDCWLPESERKEAASSRAPVRPPETVDVESSSSKSDYDEEALIRIGNLKRPDGSNMLTHAVELFRVSSEEALQKLRAAAAKDDAAAIRFVAHKLKSSCANLGAMSMAGLCRELEQLARNEKTSKAGIVVEQLESQRLAVNAWLQEKVVAIV